MKRSNLLDAIRRAIPSLSRPMPAAAGAPLQFSSSGGSGGSYDDPDDEYLNDEAPEEPASRRRRVDERRPTAARQRTVQTDPDDRYWTDYLRIALPVIGLLLVIAVFWYWAQQLIDDNGEDLTPTEPPGLAEVVDDTATEPPASPPALVDTQGQSTPQNPLQQAIPSPTPAPDAAGETTDPAAAEQPAGEEPPAEQPPADTAGGIAPDVQVSVIEGPLNLRAEASTESEIVTTLETGTTLTVLSGPVEAETFIWWEVVDNATANQGFVAEQFIQPAQ